MALLIIGIKRIFKHGNIELADPNENSTPEEVMNYYSNLYPELTTSTITGPTMKEDVQVFVFKTVVGTKG